MEVDKGTAGVTLEAACVGVEGKEMEGEAVSACVEMKEAGRRSSGAKNR